jgi:hypothetical protein
LNLRGIDLETLGVNRESLERRLLEAGTTQKRGKVIRAPVQPQRQRQEARKRLDERVKSGAKQLLNELGIRIAGYELPRLFPTGTVNNLAASIVLLNLEVYEYLGVGPDARDKMTREELQRAHDEMDVIIDRAAEKVRRRRAEEGARG